MRRSNHPTNLTRKEEVDIYSIETAYLMDIGIGTPRRPFLVIVDTGSCDFWVTDHRCDDPACHNKERYNQFFSRSTSGPLEAFDISYIDSKIRGDLYRDHVYLGSSRVNNMCFGGATVLYGDSLVGSNFDGIMGLCPGGTRWEGGSLLQKLHAQQNIDHQRFSIWLSSDLKEGGILTIGRYAEEYADGKIQWFRSIRRNKWATKLTSFKFGKTELGGERSIAVVDSGCTNIILPVRIADAIHDRMGARFSKSANAYEVRCEDVWEFPPIHFTIDGLKVSLSADQYISEQVHGCFSLLDDKDVIRKGRETIILGGPFLRAYFTAYDAENRRFGIAHPAEVNKLKWKPTQCMI
jgi:hypothetical protein